MPILTSDDTRRANHNALERKRRIFQKDKLQELRERVPLITNDKASMVEILSQSTVYIHHLNHVSAQQVQYISLTAHMLRDHAPLLRSLFLDTFFTFWSPQEREIADLKRLNSSLMERVMRAANGTHIAWPPEAFRSSLVRTQQSKRSG